MASWFRRWPLLPVERAVRELRGYGYKASRQRLALLRALAAEPHQNIVELRWRCPRVGLVTINRNLELFAELGLVRRLDLGDEPRYALTRVI
jgi:Fur family transcriptional regulator, ferric uptake regulator